MEMTARSSDAAISGTGPLSPQARGHVLLPPSPRSLAVGPQFSTLGSHPVLCASIPGLVPKQLRFCRNYVDIMPGVAEGVKVGIQECQHQFRGRRWNCTTVNDSLAIFGPVLDRGTRAPGVPGGCALGAGPGPDVPCVVLRSG